LLAQDGGRIDAQHGAQGRGEADENHGAGSLAQHNGILRRSLVNSFRNCFRRSRTHNYLADEERIHLTPYHSQSMDRVSMGLYRLKRFHKIRRHKQRGFQEYVIGLADAVNAEP
jgi:hypothetical protein